MSLEVANSALDEMTVRTNQGQFGQDFTLSVPCQLRFREKPTQNTRRFHVELMRAGFAPLDKRSATRRHPDADPVPLFYDGEICSKEHWGMMKVWMGRGGVVRLYPRENWDVKLYELADIIRAIEKSFAAELEHDPIEDDADPDDKQANND